MLKAIFLDMDETLCDTSGADIKACEVFQEVVQQHLPQEQAASLTRDYLEGVYKRLPDTLTEKLLPVVDEYDFRCSLIVELFSLYQVDSITRQVAEQLQQTFDAARKAALDFYPGIKLVLDDWRKNYVLVVITNGPEFSQTAKINSLQLTPLVDHIIIGGLEPEEKPAVSIFEKALKLADVAADEAIHFGDKLSTDVLGANNAGIASVWISHDRPLDTRLAIEPNHIIQHPSQMAALISSL